MKKFLRCLGFAIFLSPAILLIGFVFANLIYHREYTYALLLAGTLVTLIGGAALIEYTQ